MTTIENAYNRFCTEQFPLPGEDQVSALERLIGVKFPEDYRRYVLDFNGGYFNEPEIAPVGENCPRCALDFMSGIGASHWESELGRSNALALFDDNDPPKIAPIGGTAMGSLIVLITEPEGRGEIWLKEAFSRFYFLADGIAGFFDLLRTPTWETPT